MLIIPAIDLKGGQCVRLKQGLMEQVTVFSSSPGEQARAWLALGVGIPLIAGPVGYLVRDAVGVGPLAGVMAFAPGSMEVLVAVALTLNAHPAYVAVHHLTRTMLLLAALQALHLFQEPPRA